ncbi:hypothetical protein [Streptomyces sp. NPDC056987]|uniref:hypothetical protein n=1 Tax=Streptomyces sp. NPDC056987 TaxID=3345988 RepID=UPI003641B673
MLTSSATQIMLFHRRDAGIVAFAHGEKYHWAQPALESSGSSVVTTAPTFCRRARPVRLRPRRRI